MAKKIIKTNPKTTKTNKEKKMTAKKEVKEVKTPKAAKKTDLKCVWDMGTPCSDDTTEIEFFNKQIRVPVCKRHVEDHRIIMLLHKNGYDVEEILQQTPDWRKQEALTIQLAGLNTDDVAL